MDIGLPELLVVLVIVILLFGPGRLAGVMGELGKAIHEFRKGLTDSSVQEKKEPQDTDQNVDSQS